MTKDERAGEGAVGVTAAAGFLAGGIACGIKKHAVTPDLGIVFSERPAAVAAVFTQNRAAAAPVLLNRTRVGAGSVHAVVANSGNANACTGEQGMKDAITMGRLVANRFALQEQQVLVLSTGVIGVPLPMDRISEGIAMCPVQPHGGQDFAEAIITTDTRTKSIALSFEHDGHPVTIGGSAKGSGMIHPNMATMLAVITTDASVRPAFLQLPFTLLWRVRLMRSVWTGIVRPTILCCCLQTGPLEGARSTLLTPTPAPSLMHWKMYARIWRRK